MRLLKLTFGIISISLFIACGGNGSQEESTTKEKTMTSKEIMQQKAKERAESPEASKSEEDAANKNEQDVVEITIEGNDQMRFNLDEMKVKAGSTVKLTLKHVGKMTKQQMGHNWVLLTKGTDIMEFGQKAAGAADNDYIPEAEASKVIANTKTLGGGEETTITFEAPEKGTYDFICSFPGHVALMKGKFIVQ
ncbi:azurin [Marivirga harenae]|uniref:azurin n=1 Tax=Marivirga harenae TaxID=2010992 RepID=UPI0026DF9727|nr:azurin [Marivirga harenae]WKV11704.1 azurin [Marivirga harenae]|tara:strand:+ start:206165 stop:206743 length:579 start_codon:yes stop_codon:yes gene_type:complete